MISCAAVKFKYALKNAVSLTASDSEKYGPPEDIRADEAKVMYILSKYIRFEKYQSDRMTSVSFSFTYAFSDLVILFAFVAYLGPTCRITSLESFFTLTV